MKNESNLKPQFAFFGSLTSKEIKDAFLSKYGKRPERNGNIWQLQFYDGTSISITRREDASSTFQRLYEGFAAPIELFGLEEVYARDLNEMAIWLEATKQMEFWFEFSSDSLAAHAEVRVLLDCFLEAKSGYAYKLEESEFSSIGSPT